jgi:alkylation response protein AidB-like acyl-CoA dehydrogenase
MAQPRDFGFGPEEAMLRDSARRFLDEKAPIDRVRALVAADHHVYESPEPPARWDESLWKDVVELGWTALAVPERAGGAGMKLVAVAALAEEIGRHAFPSPLPATLHATFALAAAPTGAADTWLGRVAAGDPASLAVVGENGSWESEPAGVSAREEGAIVSLDGAAHYVLDARKSAFFVVAARSAAGVGLYAVPSDASGLAIVPDRIVDLTRDQARLVLRGVRVDASSVVAPPPSGGDALRRALPALLTMAAADIAGAAEWQLQTTVDYAKLRTQFDRPLGFFQAVKHPIVNMMLAIDETRSLVYNAAAAFDHEPERAEVFARMAKASASDTAAFCSSRSVQLHGGIGFTWESDLHLYFKRQLHSQFLFGDGILHRRMLAEAM